MMKGIKEYHEQNIAKLSPLLNYLKARILFPAFLLLLFSTLIPSSVYAAKQSFYRGIISISGTIDNDDYKLFQTLLDSNRGLVTHVYLNSLGGSINSAVLIGELIRRNQLHTVVIAKDKCASACGLIWLGGAKRTIEPTGTVGFHASYQIRNGKKQESGQSNALVGAYLNKLGLSFDAVLFVTKAPPDKITWLSESEAKRVGIIYDNQVVREASYVIPHNRLTKDILETEFNIIPLIANLRDSSIQKYNELWHFFTTEIERGNSLDTTRVKVLKQLYPFALKQTAVSSDDVILAWSKLHKAALFPLSATNPTACLLIHYGDLTLANTSMNKIELLNFYDEIILSKRTPNPDHTTEELQDFYVNSFRTALWRSADFTKLLAERDNNFKETLDFVLKPSNDREKRLLCNLLNGALEALSGTHLEAAYYRQQLQKYNFSAN